MADKRFAKYAKRRVRLIACMLLLLSSLPVFAVLFVSSPDVKSAGGALAMALVTSGAIIALPGPIHNSIVRRIATRKKEDVIKRKMLESFDVDTLLRIARREGIRVRRGRKKYIVDVLHRNLSFADVAEYARLYGRTKSVRARKSNNDGNPGRNNNTSTQNTTVSAPVTNIDNVYWHVINLLQRYQPPRVMINSEKELEDMVYYYLTSKLGRDAVRRQARVGNTKWRIDLVVFDRIGIELKLVKKIDDVDRVRGQVTRYLKYFDRLIVVLAFRRGVDAGDLIDDLIRNGVYVVTKVV